MTVDEIKEMLVDCVVRNMVFLLNVGPDRHGEITPLVAERFREVGKWLEKVGDAVYSTRGGPWNPKDGIYGFTYKDNTIFVYMLGDFTGDTFTLPALNEGQEAIKAYVVADNTPVAMTQNKDREVTLSGFSRSDKVATILAVELDLHDNITQMLCVMVMHSQALAAKLTDHEIFTRNEALQLRDILGIAADEVEHILRNLRPRVLEHLGLKVVLNGVMCGVRLHGLTTFVNQRAFTP